MRLTTCSGSLTYTRAKLGSVMEAGFNWIEQYRYGAIFVLLMLGIVGLPIPDELLLIFVGYLTFKGTLRLEAAEATAFLGSATGISLSYAIGRYLGPPALMKFGHLMHVRPERLAETQRWVGRWGKYSLLVGYFFPGVRQLTALVVGASLLPPATFARFAYTGALIWSAIFIALGYFAGEEWRQLAAILHRSLIAVILGLFVLASAVTVILIRRSST
jgi:membrane protein DedA with SNARE-associated domain